MGTVVMDAAERGEAERTALDGADAGVSVAPSLPAGGKRAGFSMPPKEETAKGKYCIENGGQRWVGGGWVKKVRERTTNERRVKTILD